MGEFNRFKKEVEQDGFKLLTNQMNKKTEKLPFLCPKGHEFTLSYSEYERGRRCAVCAGKKVIHSTSFGYNFLDISKQWHDTKNGELTPFHVSNSSAKKVWWICPKGHEWKSSIANRTKGTGCPYCNGKKVLPEDSLGGKSTKLSHEWHPNKNGELTPYNVAPNSNKKVWWLCEKGHVWKTSVSARYGSSNKKGTNCPYCSGNKMLPEKSLLHTHPQLVKEWHPIKNDGLSQNEVTFGSTKKVWWLCDKGHEWEASCNNRSRGRGCPYCTGKIVTNENSLHSLHPKLVKEWCVLKNGRLTPNDVSVKSDKKIWWMCSNGHEWKARISKRTLGQGCPVCNIYYGTSFKEQAIYFYTKQLFPDAVNKKTIKVDDIFFEVDVYIPSIKTGIEYDGEQHSGNKQIKRDEKKNLYLKNKIKLIRVRCKGLPKIKEYGTMTIAEKQSGIEAAITELLAYLTSKKNELKQKLSNINIDINKDAVRIYEMYLKYKKSNQLAKGYPQLAREWHQQKNGQLSLNQFTKGSNVKVWWVCEKGHEWKTTINHRTNGTGCPYCKGRLLVPENSLAILNPELAKELHPSLNGELKAEELACNSNEKVWWLCEKGHRWEATVNNRNQLNRGCPFCSGRFATKDNNLYAVNPQLAREWHPYKNIGITPNNIKPNSGKRAWWMCEKGHEWQAIIQSRNRGNGCPECCKLNRKNAN